MNLNDLENRDNTQRANHSILIYGQPKVGKTRLVGTSARIPEVKGITWIDLDNGIETLRTLNLTVEEKAKFKIIKIPDTRQTPRGAETVLRMLSSPEGVTICEKHGKIDCKEVSCIDANKKSTGTFFRLQDMTHEELLVIDSGSQLGDSCLALACLGKPADYKPQLDDYGSCSKFLADICSVLQAATFTNPIVISHVMSVTEEFNGIKRDKFYPLMGSTTFSQKCAKYFGTVAFAEIKLGKHIAGSGSTYKPDHITGSRLGALLEGKEPDMEAILIGGGVLKRIASTKGKV